MTDATLGPEEAAAAWHIAMRTMDANRWTDFIDWLEADPAHAAAYDAVAMADHQLGALRASPTRGAHALSYAAGATRDLLPGERTLPANDAVVDGARPARSGFYRHRWAIGGGALAACLAGLVMVTTMPQRDQSYAVATAPGAPRTVALGEGSQVIANGATRLKLDHGNARKVELQDGEALFSVHHDAAKEFSVKVGNYRIVDMGTVFNVLRNGHRLSVAVSEGSVVVQSQGPQVVLRAGQSLTIDEDEGLLVRGKAESVGSWQTGDLQFSGESLADVAAAIHRRTGATIKLSNALSELPFTGNIKLTGEAAQDVAHLATLVGATLRREGEDWTLSPARSGR